MSNETMVTIRGWLAADPVMRSVGGYAVANFRVGCTPRRFNRARQEWVDAPTQWYAVSAWRDLAANCERSLHRGEPVIVHGRLEHRTYINSAGAEVVSLEIDAQTVGHDLSRGVDNFSKSPIRPREVPPIDEESRREPATPVADPFSGMRANREEPEPEREPDRVGAA